MLKKIFKFMLSIFAAVCLLSVRTVSLHADDSILAGITSEYAYVVDYETGQVLAEKNADTKMYPASMTKIMTAIVAIENLNNLDDKITITSEMLSGLAEMDASVAGFQINDEPTVRDLLYGLALPSGADAANALAMTVSGSLSSFVELMNQKAASLGMNGTHFTNVTGLHDDDHYSTAKDIATLLQYAIQDSTFAEVFSARSYTTSPLASTSEGITLTSSTFKGITAGGYQLDELIGSKTGYTDIAGYCLAAWSQVNDMHVITVTAHADSSSSTSHIADLASIMSVLRSYKKNTVTSKDTAVKNIIVDSIFYRTTHFVYVPGEIVLDTPSADTVTYQTNLPDEIGLTNEDQELSFTLTILINGSVYKQMPYTCTIPKDADLIARLLRSVKNMFQ